MPRKKNDGRGRLGGRQPGSLNKDNPLKILLHTHSVDYFTPSIPAETVDFLRDKNGNTIKQYVGKTLSQYELDLLRMKASDRTKAELELLNYHTPKMQSISADLGVKEQNLSLSLRIARLAAGEDIPSAAEEE